VSAARSVVTDTHLAMGKDIAHWDGARKDAFDAGSKQLLRAASLYAKYAEALSAARGGLRLP
jgi:hypothetical protein